MHRPGMHNVYYCHTPPRFAYDLEDWYRERTPAWQRPALTWLAARIRRDYEEALEHLQTAFQVEPGDPRDTEVRAGIRDDLGLAERIVIVGGAIGNLIDRVLLGNVIDFVQVYLPFIPLAMFNPWPAFNVADSAITVGIFIFLVHLLFKKMPD